MIKIYTVDNGIINHVRVDEATRTAYVAKLSGMEHELPGFNDYDDDDDDTYQEEHDFVEYYTQHDDMLPWHEIEISIPYKKIFLAKDDFAADEDENQIVSVLMEVDMDRIPHEKKGVTSHAYAFIGGDIRFFSTRKEIVKFRCELGNSASLDPYASTESITIEYYGFRKCIGYERDSSKKLKQTEINSMLETVAYKASPDF